MAERGYYQYANGEKIYMDEDIKVIYRSAVHRCYNGDEDNRLCRVFIPNSVIAIGDSAFQGMDKLAEVCFEENSDLQYIGFYAFDTCKKLKSFDFAALGSLRLIDSSAFIKTGLEHIDLRENYGLKYIGDGVFMANDDLLTVHWNDRIYMIPDSCFDLCVNLLSITDVNMVQYVERCAFSRCNSLVKTDLDSTYHTLHIEKEGNDSILKLIDE